MNKIKEFFNEYGKIVSKILINHIAMSIFGLMVCLCTKTMNNVLFWIAGVFATLLYMFLLYMVMHHIRRLISIPYSLTLLHNEEHLFE